MRKLTLLSCLSLVIAVMITSCTKEGPEGPVGASGSQGATGNAGPAGPAGPQGPQGTTTVVYSPWFAFAAADWVDSTSGAFGGISRAIRNAPAITQTILDQGVVLAYVNLAGIQQLPVNLPSPFPDNFIVQLGTFISLSKLIFYFADPITADASGINFTGQLRYVVIPGSIAGGRGINSVTTYEGYTEKELRAMSYEQVQQLFHIPAEGTNIR
jgi:hypothetical protein